MRFKAIVSNEDGSEVEEKEYNLDLRPATEYGATIYLTATLDEQNRIGAKLLSPKRVLQKIELLPEPQAQRRRATG